MSLELRKRHKEELRAQIAANQERHKREHAEYLLEGEKTRSKLEEEKGLIEVGCMFYRDLERAWWRCSSAWLALTMFILCKNPHFVEGYYPLLSITKRWRLCFACLQVVIHSACRPSGSASCMKWRFRACLQSTGQSWPERSSATGSQQHCSSEPEANDSSAQPDAARCRAGSRKRCNACLYGRLLQGTMWVSHPIPTGGSRTGSDLQSLTENFVDQN